MMRLVRSIFLRSVAGTIFVQGTSALVLFLLSVILARQLGTDAFGAYEFADTWIDVLVLFAVLGFDRLLIRQVAIHDAQQEHTQIWYLLRYAWRRVLIVAIIIGVLMLGAMSYYFLYLNQPIRADAALILTTLAWAMMLLPLRTLLKLNQAHLQGLRRTALAYLPDYVIRPALLLILVWWFVDSAPQAMETHLFTTLIALSLSALFLAWFTPRPEDDVPSQKMRLWGTLMPFMVISGVNLLNIRGGTLVIGLIADLETVAHYSVAVRVASIVALMIVSTSAVAAPRVAQLYHANDTQALQRFITISTRGIALLAIPAAVLLMVFGQMVLRLFGVDFIPAYGALIVMCISQMVNAATGFVGWIMLMTGQERVMMRILILTATAHIILIPIFTPLWGALGAATATAIANSATNIALTWFAYRRLGLNASIFSVRQT